MNKIINAILFLFDNDKTLNSCYKNLYLKYFLPVTQFLKSNSECFIKREGYL